MLRCEMNLVPAAMPGQNRLPQSGKRLIFQNFRLS